MDPYKGTVMSVPGADGVWLLPVTPSQRFVMAVEVSLCYPNTNKELRAKAHNSFENPLFFLTGIEAA